LQGLRDSAAPAFAPATSDGEGVTGSETPLEPQLPLAELVELLRQQSLSASDRFSLMSPQLRRVLSKYSYDRVCNHIDKPPVQRRGRRIAGEPAQDAADERPLSVRCERPRWCPLSQRVATAAVDAGHR
jgi:hypothetical protein